MVIAIEISALRNPRSGTGRYLVELLGVISKIPGNEVLLVAQSSQSSTVAPENFKIIYETSWFWSKMPLLMWIRYRIPKLLQKTKYDIFLSPITIAPKDLNDRALLVSIVYDLNHLIVPETQTIGTRIFHSLFLEHDLRRSDYVVAISSGTASRVSDLVGVHPHRIIQPPLFNHQPAVMSRESYEDLSRFGNYLLFVGAIEPRKNLNTFIDAFEGVSSLGLYQDFKVVLVGSASWKSKGLLKRISRSGGKYILLNSVNDTLLSKLYNQCFALVLPSLYEGYGMPVAEARRWGKRILATRIPEIVEAASGCGVFVEPSYIGLFSGLVKLIGYPEIPPNKACDFEKNVKELYSDLLKIRQS
jgi:glycosyltransferase involved in cell wall biosynthesis